MAQSDHICRLTPLSIWGLHYNQYSQPDQRSVGVSTDPNARFPVGGIPKDAADIDRPPDAISPFYREGGAVKDFYLLVTERRRRQIKMGSMEPGSVAMNGRGDLIFKAGILDNDTTDQWRTATVLFERATGEVVEMQTPSGFTLSPDGRGFGNGGVLAASGPFTTTDQEGNPVGTPSRHGVLLPVDIDFVHPVTGEMDESREQSEGGYIPIRKDDETPVTKLKLHKLDGMPSAQFKLVFGSAKMKIWKDAGRTQAVTSDQTTFPANADTELFFEGVEKSASARDIEIGLKIVIGSTESSAVTAKATVVQSEFPLIARAFIPYRWTQPDVSPATYTIAAEGDNRGLVLQDGPFATVPFRCRQKMIVTPYADLHAQTDIVDQRATAPGDTAAPLSRHYDKNVAVPIIERSGVHGSELIAGVAPEDSGVPQIEALKYEFKTRMNTRSVTYRLELSGEDGAMPWYIPTPNIDWKYDIKVDCTDPAKPKVNAKGQRDGFPAYEILVGTSDGTFKDVYYWRPPVQVQVGIGPLTTTTNIDQTLEVP